MGHVENSGVQQRLRWWSGASALIVLGVVASLMPVVSAAAEVPSITWLSAEDFAHGTFIVDTPGEYRLAEDISFNPNSPTALNHAISNGELPPGVASALGLSIPVDAYRAGRPLATQFSSGQGAPFSPGGLLDARYDPAAYGVGFFAAIAVAADGVVIDLNGYTIEQHPEHALLQRFFSVIELADQPFVPSQGPAGFGAELTPARHVVIRNGTIGRSAHHGIHGNANVDVTISDVDFVDFEVAAVALNGVQKLTISDVAASNRKDVPVLGTFSAARFISPYLDHLVRNLSDTTLRVGGLELTATDVRDDLRNAVNGAHHDIVTARHTSGERITIDPVGHPVEYGLFHNPYGVIDGNSYGFLVNQLGVAVNGFPFTSSDPDSVPARNIVLRDVEITSQHAFVNEIPALDSDRADPGSTPAVDPVGAVFQIRNVHPDSGAPVTISTLDDGTAVYTGNPVANAQALVAKAAANHEFDHGHLDIGRLSIPDWAIAWIEQEQTLADVGATYICNGDSMFHVNKGVIGFKMDAATNVRLHDTAVHDLQNLGGLGSSICRGDTATTSHPQATLPGYGGNATRAYTFAGTVNALVSDSHAENVRSRTGPATGFAVLTDSTGVRLFRTAARDIQAGWDLPDPPSGPNHPAIAIGYFIAEHTTATTLVRACTGQLDGFDGRQDIVDLSPATHLGTGCG